MEIAESAGRGLRGRASFPSWFCCVETRRPLGPSIHRDLSVRESRRGVREYPRYTRGTPSVNVLVCGTGWVFEYFRVRRETVIKEWLAVCVSSQKTVLG